jgi:hypothetical protein
MILAGLTSSLALITSKTVADVSVNAVNWTNVDSAGTVGTTITQQITGINTAIDLEISWTGSLGYLYASVSAVNSYSAPIYTLLTSPTTISVDNNKYVSFRLQAVGLQDNLSRSVTVKNVSDSNLTLDTFTMDVDGSTTKTASYDFNLFWDRETLVDRYDAVSTSTTAQGWFVR